MHVGLTSWGLTDRDLFMQVRSADMPLKAIQFELGNPDKNTTCIEVH